MLFFYRILFKNSVFKQKCLKSFTRKTGKIHNFIKTVILGFISDTAAAHCFFWGGRLFLQFFSVNLVKSVITEKDCKFTGLFLTENVCEQSATKSQRYTNHF